MSGRPEIIAHRGLPREHPENSLPGFRSALALEVDGIELDVHLTADGVPVVHHDPHLGRPSVPDSPLLGRPIAALTRAELAAHVLAPGVGVPTLDEVLELVDGRATVYVEVKAAAAEAVVAGRLAGCEAWTAVHSFDHRVPYRVRGHLPSLPVGVLSTSYLLDNVGAMRAVGARDLWQHWGMIDEALVAEVHRAGGRVIAWTANDRDAMEALTRLGVDGICTDVSRLAREVIGAR
ncbi:glycerophosphoryl diester phosphodiesterase [Gemmatirosa kalamazoonensis]|uniref:Glycerophosphoryl diester phosphodiesterase n=1 Tax=Gemmatirosa kalamazoonensis TaxID=861299 RepID=W0RIE7_9BACT|nr:glycerophosphodiester phosphodiesterase [Gemmatirosa kalamazoonensis]AHG90869.1 glycerophosphoryl diester phosphodiesterase [Gemmatirosa kalamazoonensis]